MEADNRLSQELTDPQGVGEPIAGSDIPGQADALNVHQLHWLRIREGVIEALAHKGLQIVTTARGVSLVRLYGAPAAQVGSTKAQPAEPPAWVPVTSELLGALEAGDFPANVWIFAPSLTARPIAAHYEWCQGRHPHGFNAEGLGRVGAEQVTHVMPFAPPAAPQPLRAAGNAVTTIEATVECHGLDTPDRVCFYEPDFYVLSNFSAFTLVWKGIHFDTSEAAYHFEKFTDADGALADVRAIQWNIRTAPSAHEAFKIAERDRMHRRRDWDDVKVGIMRDILRAKAAQHEYVRRKLLATGDRMLVENSWRDDFWGWGPNRDGQNMLGKLWMEVRAELRAKDAA